MIVIPKDWENHPDPDVRKFIRIAAWMLNEKDNDKEDEVCKGN
jgi:hypothetical protein